MYHDSLNQALESVGLGDMSCNDVNEKIGSLKNEESKRFQHNGKQVCLYRMSSGRYEIVAYNL